MKDGWACSAIDVFRRNSRKSFESAMQLSAAVFAAEEPVSHIAGAFEV
jgi:hypothetical protein